ncbi:hypothetical protein BC2230_30414 [Burkholderia cepacia]
MAERSAVEDGCEVLGNVRSRSEASHKSIRRKDGSDDDRPPGNWHGQPRSKQTHESKSDGDSRLYRKSNAAPALPSYLGHVLYRAVEPVRRYYDVRSGSPMIDCVFQQVC